jgi:hypothetical protein
LGITSEKEASLKAGGDFVRKGVELIVTPNASYRPATCALVALLALLGSVQTCPAWTSVGTGIEYQQFQIPGPNNVFVTRMDRNNPLCYIDTSLAYGRIDGYVERPSGQFARYDDALSFWNEDWGRRNDVVVAINGDYWINNIPLGSQAQSGWVIKYAGSTTFNWTTSRTTTIGNPVFYAPMVRYSTGVIQSINNINISRAANQFILYTNHYGANTKTDSTGVEVLVEMMRPNLVLNSTDPAMGIVRQIRANQGSTSIPFDHVVLSATGTPATTLQNNVSVGSPVYLYQTVPTYGQGWLKTFAASSGILVLATASDATPEPVPVPMGGEIAPRTAVAYNDDYFFFVVVDGRSTISIGMSFQELSDFCRYTLGATNAMSCDGGGSSCMVVNGTVVNVPSDGSERSVPNGVLMCVRQPKLQSTSFNSGDSIKTTKSTTMRTGPGGNYLSLVSLTSNRSGTAVDHSLRGIYAKGAYWWKCDIDGYSGWVDQSALSRTATTTLPVFTQQPVDADVCPTSNAVFTVAATGTGTLSYQWLRNGVAMADDGHFTGTATPTLTIVGANDPDVGSYRCIVTDNVGSVTSYSAAVVLKKHTIVTQHPSPVEAHPQGGLSTAVFTIAATGEGTLSYRWQKNNLDISDGGHYAGTATPTLTINNVDTSDVGDYRCRVSTICETAYSNAALLTVITSDIDADGDGDLEDFARLQNCFGISNPAVNAPDCVKADTNGDAAVNYFDTPWFRNCLTGPDIPLPPGC